MGTEVARGTLEIMKAQMDENQEENAAQALCGSVNHHDGRSRFQTNCRRRQEGIVDTGRFDT